MAQAQNTRRSDEKRFVDVTTEPDKILSPLPDSYESESMPTLLDAIKSIEHLVENIRKKAEEALSKCKNPKDKLSRDQSAALYLYSMQWPKGKHSFYSLFNRALRNEDRTKLIPYHSYLKLFMSALNKLPSKEQQVWRGVVGDLTNQYLAGTTHVWWGASSCTDKLHVTGTFLDKSQKQTLFNIKCYEGKVIKDHSEFPNESETILPPGTYLTVKSTLLLHPNAYVVELEQVHPDPKLILDTTSATSTVSKKEDNDPYLIWCDTTIDKSSENKQLQEDLRNIFDNNFNTFENGDQCENFINQKKNHRLVLIFSGQLGRDLVPKIHKLSQVISIYVYCMDKKGNEKWTKNYDKVKDVVVNKDDLISGIGKEKENEDKKIEQQISEHTIGNFLGQSNNILCSPKCPFRGYEKRPLLPLREALEPVFDTIPDLNKYIFIAIQNSRDDGKYGLTKDESAAIHIFTMEFSEHEYSLFALLNRDLRSEDRNSLKKWFPYLKLFMTALNKLPSQRCTVWRSVNRDISEQYHKDSECIWWAVSSTTLDASVLNHDSPFGGHGARTLFSIQCENGKYISDYSPYPNEKEVFLMPGFHFKVIDVIKPAPNLNMIQIKEIDSSYE